MPAAIVIAVRIVERWPVMRRPMMRRTRRTDVGAAWTRRLNLGAAVAWARRLNLRTPVARTTWAGGLNLWPAKAGPSRLHLRPGGPGLGTLHRTWLDRGRLGNRDVGYGEHCR